MGYDKSGSNNPRWKGGRRVRKDGYVLVYAPDHPFAYRNFVLEHRLVMERYVGRHLLPHELVHHKNEVKHDNRIENLELTDHAAHAAHHFAGQTYPDRWQPRADRDTLYRLYVVEGRSLKQCAEQVSISYGSVRFHLAFFDIPIRPGPGKGSDQCQRLTHARRLSSIRGRKNPLNSTPQCST